MLMYRYGMFNLRQPLITAPLAASSVEVEVVRSALEESRVRREDTIL